MTSLCHPWPQTTPFTHRTHRKRRSPCTSQCGATLLEVLISFAVLSWAVLALIQIQMTLHHLQGLSQDLALATRWAEAELEHLAAQPWRDLPMDGQHPPATQSDDERSSRFTLTRTLQTPSPSWRTIEVQVQWQHASGAPHTLRWHSARSHEPEHWPDHWWQVTH